VPKDDREAVKWYQLAAAQENACAQTALGVMYGEGRGVPQDDGEAMKWYRLGAQQGYAFAQTALGGISLYTTKIIQSCNIVLNQ
jgi:TPR repeat protein